MLQELPPSSFLRFTNFLMCFRICTALILILSPLESKLDSCQSVITRLQDELFLLSTLEQLGSIVKDDVKLGTLYVTLVLATPGAQLSDTAKVGKIKS